MVSSRDPLHHSRFAGEMTQGVAFQMLPLNKFQSGEVHCSNRKASREELTFALVADIFSV